MRLERIAIPGSLAIALPLVLACGGEAGADLDRRSTLVPTPAAGAGRDAGASDAAAPSVPNLPPPEEVPPPFMEPGCPPARTPPDITECDPLASPTGCPLGQSCFPFVSYPTGPCEVERFGTLCMPAGPGTQGESCTTDGCAADHICVSTGRGTQCVRLCSFAAGAPSVCAPGLLCLPIDIEGFGGCL